MLAENNVGSFACKVSVIVPVYNMEKYLGECLDSLVKQTISKDDIEVLLIDDGSPDNSIDIMRNYAEKNEWMKILRKENGGLSDARNYGILHAAGKYLFFLDADDTLSPETLDNVTAFFEEHYDEVDLVTYYEIPTLNGQKTKPHFRFRRLKKSGIYDLTEPENIYITQTRINVCVKNMRDDNILFDLDRSFRHEDQKYCTQIIQNRMKIGYCAEGTYIYRKQPDSIVRTYFYAYYIFESTMRFWEELFGGYEKGHVPQYIQALYLNDLNWKTKLDILLPYHYDSYKFEQAQKRIVNLLNQVDDEVIINHPMVNKYHRMYFIGMKTNNDLQHLCGPNHLVITNRNRPIHHEDKIEIHVMKFYVGMGKIKFCAVLKSDYFYQYKKPELYLVYNDEINNKQPIELRESAFNYYLAKQKTNEFWLFDLEFDLNKVKSFGFKVAVDNFYFNTYCTFDWMVYFNTGAGRYEWLIENKQITYDNGSGCFLISNVNAEALSAYHKKIRDKYKSSDKKKWLARQAVITAGKEYKGAWLYYDCKGVGRDNAYFQFDYDFNRKDGISRYYVINEENFDALKKTFPKEQRKYLIQFGSYKHRIIYLNASKIITAYIEINNTLPFTKGRYASYADLDHPKEVVYLQHGVLHAHLPWKYSRERLRLDKEVVSTRFEADNLVNHYCFRRQDLITCGMPRYDFIETEQKSVNRILFAPSWRKYLIGQDNNGWVTTEEKFRNSLYFKETQEFLNSKELNTILNEFDFYLDFKLHPIFARYKNMYHIDNQRVSMADAKVKETEYSVFITDFSSFVFDFVYLKKPIIYFLPDQELFRAGLNDYRELDLPLENAFGEVALNAEEAVKALRELLKTGCRIPEKYVHMYQKFFYHYDDKQRERLYLALTGKQAVSSHGELL